MPSSTQAGKPYIKKIINKMVAISGENARVLDLGCGRGTYARLIDRTCYKVGVDAVDYRERFGLSEWYDEFHKHDIKDVDFLRSLGKFNIVIAGDVLEHLYVDDARKVLDAMEEIGDFVLVALPYMMPQKAFGKEDWEEHKQDDLTRAVIKKRYPELFLLKEYNRQAAPYYGKPFYGYYAWYKEGNDGRQ